MSRRSEQDFVTVTCKNCQQTNREAKTNLNFSRTETQCQFFIRCKKCDQVVNVPLSEEEKENVLREIFKDFG